MILPASQAFSPWLSPRRVKVREGSREERAGPSRTCVAAKSSMPAPASPADVEEEGGEGSGTEVASGLKWARRKVHPSYPLTGLNTDRSRGRFVPAKKLKRKGGSETPASCISSTTSTSWEGRTHKHIMPTSFILSILSVTNTPASVSLFFSSSPSHSVVTAPIPPSARRCASTRSASSAFLLFTTSEEGETSPNFSSFIARRNPTFPPPIMPTRILLFSLPMLTCSFPAVPAMTGTASLASAPAPSSSATAFNTHASTTAA
mmetsp:Transcript_49932/g.128482  ORF Transcript_49932/g.128482 Transcript_49932/m.128482 type:complete len:262 (-) Transcript_49932:409-1194(-)